MSQKPRGNFRLLIGMQGGCPDADTKEIPALESVLWRRLRGVDAEKGVDVLAEGGGELRIQRRRNAVLDIWDQF